MRWGELIMEQKKTTLTFKIIKALVRIFYGEVCRSDEITDMANGLPEHVVVPYRNIPKKYYLTNKQVTEVPQK